MEVLKQTRFEQVPIALVLKIAKAEAKTTKIKAGAKKQKPNRGDK
jgi:hypothetical protein